jgi:choline dehydrogenase-like flavoprotein
MPMSEVAISMGPDALRQPAGPLPADRTQDANLSGELRALYDESQRRYVEWATTGRGVIASSLYDASCWFSTGLGDLHSHDAQISFFPCAFTRELWEQLLHVDAAQFFDDPDKRLSPNIANVVLVVNPVLPHSEGEISLISKEPTVHPAIRMNYLTDPHDMKVTIATIRRAFDIAAHWPGQTRLGPWWAPHSLAAKHGYVQGAMPKDAFLEDIARHFSLTTYHLSCTCRIGDVVDSRLRVLGVSRLRVADASIMPNIISGNTNAACVMIGEKAAEMVAADHGVCLKKFVGVEEFSEMAGQIPLSPLS